MLNLCNPVPAGKLPHCENARLQASSPQPNENAAAATAVTGQSHCPETPSLAMPRLLPAPQDSSPEPLPQGRLTWPGLQKLYHLYWGPYLITQGLPAGLQAACSAAAGLLAILYLFFLSGSAAILVAGLFLIAILITGVGTVGMVVIQEVLPDRIRGLGTGLTYSFGMVIAGNGPTAVAMVNEWAYSGQATSTAVATVCSPTALTAAAFLALAVVLHRRQATDRSGAALSP